MTMTTSTNTRTHAWVVGSCPLSWAKERERERKKINREGFGGIIAVVAVVATPSSSNRESNMMIAMHGD